ncbi:MAG: GrpB family protein [Chitinophagales bacterium]
MEPYNANWKYLFDAEAKLLQNNLANYNTTIEHIGSTAVVGLGAKPIIDIMLGLQNFNSIHEIIKVLEALNYNYIAEYDKIIPERRFLRKIQNNISTHHLHIVETDSPFWKRHLFFRDYLRNNEATRDAYYKLKVALSKKTWKDGNEYANAKSDFIRKIENINNSL